MLIIISVVLVLAFLAYMLAWHARSKIKSDKIRELSKRIRAGARTFLFQEYKIIFIFIVLITGVIFFANRLMALAFFLGSLASIIVGFVSMTIATATNGKTVEKLKSLDNAFKFAFYSGTAASLFSILIALLGVALLSSFIHDKNVLLGFAFGASFIALFMRVGGGIFTKAADVSADLVGKVEKGIAEDSPENPAVIADQVGDNVGDVAGMGADLFESFVESIVAAIIIAATASIALDTALPLKLATVAILSAFLTLAFVRKGKPRALLSKYLAASFIFALILFVMITREFFVSIAAGLFAGLIIGLSTNYYTDPHKKPVKGIASAATKGASIDVLAGLTNGMISAVVPVFMVCLATYIAYTFSPHGLFGIALSAIGMLSMLGIVLAADYYGPIVDNAAGISEFCGMTKERAKADTLDEIGNTTAAIGKGFAIGSAALTALALLATYATIAGIKIANLLDIKAVIAMLIGGIMPFWFSGLTIGAVDKTAEHIIPEIRKQLKSRKEPDYNRVIAITTRYSLKQLVMPALIAVIMPFAVGFLLGKNALAAFIGASIVTAFVLAVFMANAGASMDNAKKYIETGKLGGKGSEAHKASVVGDTVGDPLKDTAGPSLNILIKIMAMASLLFAILMNMA